MKLDRQKYDLAKARACKGQKELMAEGIPKGTLCRAAGGRIFVETRDSGQDCQSSRR